MGRANALTMGSNQTGTPHAVPPGKTRAQETPSPGAPILYEQENRSLSNFEKNPEKILTSSQNPSTSIIVSHETIGGVIVAQGEYLPEYCEQMTEFFEKAEKTKTIYETMTWKNGEVREVEKEVPLPPPQFSEFARSIGVNHRKLKTWAKKYPAFAESYEECKDIFKEFIIANGLTGKYPGQFATFVAKNETDMKDKTVNENYNFNMTEYLNSLEREEPFEGTVS